MSIVCYRNLIDIRRTDKVTNDNIGQSFPEQLPLSILFAKQSCHRSVTCAKYLFKVVLFGTVRLEKTYA